MGISSFTSARAICKPASLWQFRPEVVAGCCFQWVSLLFHNHGDIKGMQMCKEGKGEGEGEQGQEEQEDFTGFACCPL